MRPTTVLATLTGRDRPGVTAAFFASLAAHDVEIRDVEQVVIREQLLLAVLLDLHGDIRTLRSSISSTSQALGMDSECLVTDDPVPGAASRTWPCTHVTVLGRPLRAGALSTLAQRIADLGGNIESVLQLSAERAPSIEMLVRADPPGDLRRVLHRAAEDAGVDVAIEAAELLRSPKRLIFIDLDRVLAGDDATALLTARAGARPQLAHAGSAEERAALLAGLSAQDLDAVRDQRRLMPGAAAFVTALRGLGLAVGAFSDGFSVFADRLVADLGLDFFAANELELCGGRVTGRLTGPAVDGAAKADALRRFAAQAQIPLSQAVVVGCAADDVTPLLEAGLAVSLCARSCSPAQGPTSDAFDSVLFVLGAGTAEPPG